MTRRRTPARRSAPNPAPRKHRAWSLRFELGELRDAVDGARILLDISRHAAGDSTHDQRRAPHASAAVLGLVDARMQLLERALAGDIDGKLVLTASNTVTGTDAEMETLREDDVLVVVEE